MRNTYFEQLGAAAGIVFVAMQIAAQTLIQLSAPEPAFNAPSAAIAAFFAAQNSQLFFLGDYLSTLSMIPFLWFLARLWSTLRTAEGEPGWLSLVTVGSGLMLVAAVTANSAWQAAVFRKDQGIDPQTLRTLFDQGNFSFANMWVFLGSLSLTTGVLTFTTRALPRWLGVSAVLIAVGFLAARAVWASSGLVFVPFTVFLLWLVAVSIVLLRRPMARQVVDALAAA